MAPSLRSRDSGKFSLASQHVVGRTRRSLAGLHREVRLDETLHDGTGDRRTEVRRRLVRHDDGDGDVGSVAGAKAISQSSVFFFALPVWAVPVLAATSYWPPGIRLPAPCRAVTTFSISGTMNAAWAGVNGVFHTESL